MGAVQFWIPTVVVCALVAFLVRRKQRVRGLLRPSSLIAIGCMSLLNAATAWLLGISRGGLDIEESCEYRNGVPFDEKWNDAHYMESQKFFPLHAKCSATVDLVPAWVNPTIIALLLLSAVCLCMAVHRAVRNSIVGRNTSHA